jgi:hypothetical protein
MAIKGESFLCICTLSLHRSFIKYKYYTWAIILNQVSMAIEEECTILLSQVSVEIEGECLPFSLAKLSWPLEENVNPVLPSGEASAPRVFVGPFQVT